MQDEVTWVLDTIKTGWPGSWPADDDGDPLLYRINRDEPEILETGERTRSLDLSKASAIGAALGSRSPTPTGTEYRNRVETVVSVRFEGLTSRGGEWGHVDSAADVEQLVRYAQHALLAQRSYPTINDVDQDAIGSVAYHSLFVENETDQSHDHRDYFRRDWDVRFVGYSNPDS
ncbi:hypothetical protein [Salinilacihabitans rarus]|uniref:hypothetical protein n=1 Tax=Salinilacihabitans rarus TaxID=2961596 RepID=UPI0020C8524A|nr:hypothetical protein [Salinilacihabitans rarus]